MQQIPKIVNKRSRVIPGFGLTMGITVSMLSLLVLIPLLFTRRSHYARFHVNQGLILLVFSTAYTLVTRIFIRMLDMLFGGVYAAIPTTLSTIFNIGSVFFLILIVYGIANAVNGRAKELPLIGWIRFLF